LPRVRYRQLGQDREGGGREDAYPDPGEDVKRVRLSLTLVVARASVRGVPRAELRELFIEWLHAEDGLALEDFQTYTEGMGEHGDGIQIEEVL